MKAIKYQVMSEVNHGTKDEPNIVQTFNPHEIRCSEETFEANYAMALKEAYNGEVTVEEVEDPVTVPTQLDRVEAQVAYIAMMTDLMLPYEEEV